MTTFTPLLPITVLNVLPSAAIRICQELQMIWQDTFRRHSLYMGSNPMSFGPVPSLTWGLGRREPEGRWLMNAPRLSRLHWFRGAV